MRKHLAIMTILALFISPFCGGFEAQAAGQQAVVDLKLPEGVKITKESDITANMLSRMIGESFNFVTGIKDTSDPNSKSGGGLGYYSGLVVSVLALLNLGAMAFVATSIIYMWGIFAVTTAHEGKKLGGSQYNSLWVPVRHAMSFTLVVPVLNGLSLMQVAILACIGLSINFANVVWDGAGQYLIKYAHTGIIDSSTGATETEAWAAIPVMFTGAVIQEALYNDKDKWSNTRLRNKPGTETMIVSPLQRYKGETVYKPADLKRKTYYVNDPDGQYIVNKDHQGGVLTVRLRSPAKLSEAKTSKFTLSMPKKTDIGKEDGMTQKMYDLKMELTEIRLGALLNLFESVRNNAVQYLRSQDATGSSMSVLKQQKGDEVLNLQAHPELRGIEAQVAVNKYCSSINEMSRPIIDEIIATEKANPQSNTAISIATAIDGGDKGSKVGWASAGLFSFTLAALQQKLDNAFMKSMEIDKLDSSYPDKGWFKNVFGTDLGESTRKAIEQASDYCAMQLLDGTHFSGMASTDSTTSSKIYEEITKLVTEHLLNISGVKTNSSQAYGLTGRLLNEFKSYDPIVVIQKFGDGFINLGCGSIVAGVLAWGADAFIAKVSLPGVGIVLLGMGFTALLIGIIFGYIVPITPIIFWLRALASWLFMVIEALVAAPFWVCAHALPEGHGFAGQHAKRGYMMLLQIVIYPTLLVIGAVFAVAMVQGCGYLFTTLLDFVFSKISRTYITLGFFADVSFAIIFVSVMYYLSFTIFTKGINYLPEHVLQWCGGGGSAMGLKDEDHATQQTIVAGAAFSNHLKGIGGGIQSHMGAVSNRYGGNKPRGGGGSDGSGGVAIPDMASSDATGGGSGGGLSKGLERFKRRKANNNGEMSQIAPKPSNG